MSDMSTWRDPQVRHLLLEQLRREHASVANVQLVHELTLPSQVRMDVALLTDRLLGFEIKSAVDRLDRLPGQVLGYGAVCASAELITAEEHLKQALKIVPCWWGVRVLRLHEGVPTLLVIRPPVDNAKVDSNALAQLLWRTELVSLLVLHDVPRAGFSRATRPELARLVAEALPLAQVESEVVRVMKARAAWNSGMGQILRTPTTSKFLQARMRPPVPRRVKPRASPLS